MMVSRAVSGSLRAEVESLMITCANGHKILADPLWLVQAMKAKNTRQNQSDQALDGQPSRQPLDNVLVHCFSSPTHDLPVLASVRLGRQATPICTPEVPTKRKRLVPDGQRALLTW